MRFYTFPPGVIRRRWHAMKNEKDQHHEWSEELHFEYFKMNLDRCLNKRSYKYSFSDVFIELLSEKNVYTWRVNIVAYRNPAQ